MNIADINLEDLEDEWINPLNSDEIRTLRYKEYDNGQVFGYWMQFRPDGSEIWCSGCKVIQEYEKVIISNKVAGTYLHDTPIDEVNDLAQVGEGYIVDADMEDDCYYFYTISHDGKFIFKMPCHIESDGYTSHPEEDFMCETYTVIDGITEGFE